LTSLFPSAGPLGDAVTALNALGASPFELIARSPAERHGPRVTLAAGSRAAEVARAAGLADHPWGPPRWVGLRRDRAGRLLAKPYHLPPAGRGDASGPDLPGFRLVMRARWEGLEERYYRREGALGWGALADLAEARFGLRPPALPWTPRLRDGALGLSLCWRGQDLIALSAFAGASALPADLELFQTWAERLPAAERAPFERLALLVRALGPPPLGSYTGLVSVTVEPGGAEHRAISLRIPRSGEDGWRLRGARG